MANHYRNWVRIFQNYSLEMLQTKLYQVYGIICIEFDYCVVEVYQHVLPAFPAKAQDGDMLLASTSDG
jgi:hypothetical protein